MVNNIKNNTISEIDAKKDLNTLNEIKNAEITKYKKGTPGHKDLLNLFDHLLDVILIGKTLESESQEDKNENQNQNQNENKNDDYENEDDETMDQNKKIKDLNDNLNEIIDKSNI